MPWAATPEPPRAAFGAQAADPSARAPSGTQAANPSPRAAFGAQAAADAAGMRRRAGGQYASTARARGFGGVCRVRSISSTTSTERPIRGQASPTGRPLRGRHQGTTPPSSNI